MATKPLSWAEIRDRAMAFVSDWRDETRESAESQTFWNEWFSIFGISRRRYVTFEKHATRTTTGGRGRIDAFWPGVIAVEHKSKGKSLADAESQALDYLNSVAENELPRQVITSDFASFRVLDLESRETVAFPIEELPEHIELFGHLAGYTRRVFVDQEAVSVRAAEIMGKLYDELAANGYEGHDLKVFLVRIMFILFADDTGVWERGQFEDFLENRTAEDGSDTGPLLERLFRVLDTPEAKRQSSLDPYLARFPYINGSLFHERIDIPDFNTGLRRRLLACSAFDWSAISPAIFGSMFQSVMDTKARRSLGAHYTSEQNILKVITSLFLDDLREEFGPARNSVQRLNALHEKLARLTFFDPAAGCGNFLMLAYREVRRLEFDILARIREVKGNAQQHLDISRLCKVNVSQFHAIEIEEFPARIAETAMYLVDHLENMRVSKEFGLYFARFPIVSEAKVQIGNAIRLDWNDVLPAEKCSFLFGNPPFVGMALLSDEQQADNRFAFDGLPGVSRTGRLDYVACWYAKAVKYMKGTQIRAAFVSTSSITQGEQVRSWGPMLLSSGFEIDFAHRTFRWTNEARGQAAVHVVIVGFSHGGAARQRLLFDYPDIGGQPLVVAAKNINPYLVDAPNVVPRKRSAPFHADLPIATQGSKPWDGGNLLVGKDEIAEVRSDPHAAKYLRRYCGATELLYNEDRWCLWLVDADPRDIKASALLRDRLARVREFRAQSKTAAVREKAKTPSLFSERRQPTGRYIAMPEVSSENRYFVPAAFLSPKTIASNKLIMWPGGDLWLFGVLQSSMFTAWVAAVSGRLKSDFQIAPGTVYNTFPFPDAASGDRAAVAAAADGVLVARKQVEPLTLAEMYDANSMPEVLRKAHDKLDRLVDRLFGKRKAISIADRQAILFSRYLELDGPLAAKEPKSTVKGRRKAAGA